MQSQWEDFPLMINQWQLLKMANVWMMWDVENGVFLFKKLYLMKKPVHSIMYNLSFCELKKIITIPLWSSFLNQLNSSFCVVLFTGNTNF